MLNNVVNLKMKERKACPACGNGSFKKLFDCIIENEPVGSFIQSYYGSKVHAALYGAPFIVSQCSNCSLIFQKTVLNERSMEQFYDVIINPDASLNKRAFASFHYFQNLTKEVSIIAALNRGVTPAKISVLDFGMGWGHWAMISQAMGFDTWGAELSSERIAYARKFGLKIFDFQDIDQKSQQFNFINTDQVFEHLDEPAQILKLLTPRLKRNGVLKIFVPDGSKGTHALKPGWMPTKGPFQPIEHINSFNKQSLEMLARDSGLEPLPLSMVLGSNFELLRRYIIRSIDQRPSWYFRKI